MNTPHYASKVNFPRKQENNMRSKRFLISLITALLLIGFAAGTGQVLAADTRTPLSTSLSPIFIPTPINTPTATATPTPPPIRLFEEELPQLFVGMLFGILSGFASGIIGGGIIHFIEKSTPWWLSRKIKIKNKESEFEVEIDRNMSKEQILTLLEEIKKSLEDISTPRPKSGSH